MGESGFEPLKSVTTDLQSVPFGRSGTLPYLLVSRIKKCGIPNFGAGERTRTPDLLITNHGFKFSENQKYIFYAKIE